MSRNMEEEAKEEEREKERERERQRRRGDITCQRRREGQRKRREDMDEESRGRELEGSWGSTCGDKNMAINSALQHVPSVAGTC